MADIKAEELTSEHIGQQIHVTVNDFTTAEGVLTAFTVEVDSATSWASTVLATTGSVQMDIAHLGQLDVTLSARVRIVSA